MHTSKRMSPAIIMLLLFITTGWIKSDVFVLCIAPGGHVAIEPGQERCASPSDVGQRGPDASLVGITHAEACCAPCADVPLGFPVFARATGPRNHVEHLQKIAAPAWAALPPAGGTQEAIGPTGATACAAAPLPASGFKTVVLRC
jgi:hypothetical protein